jgi:hypothetical protein
LLHFEVVYLLFVGPGGKEKFKNAKKKLALAQFLKLEKREILEMRKINNSDIQFFFLLNHFMYICQLHFLIGKKGVIYILEKGH